jgi:hypothetical protein
MSPVVVEQHEVVDVPQVAVCLELVLHELVERIQVDVASSRVECPRDWSAK